MNTPLSRQHLHTRSIRVARYDGTFSRIATGPPEFIAHTEAFYAAPDSDQAYTEPIEATDPDNLGCPPDCHCRSERLSDRLRAWWDNSAWHHRLVANGPLWWLCGGCRALRRDP